MRYLAALGLLFAAAQAYGEAATEKNAGSKLVGVHRCRTEFTCQYKKPLPRCRGEGSGEIGIEMNTGPFERDFDVQGGIAGPGTPNDKKAIQAAADLAFAWCRTHYPSDNNKDKNNSNLQSRVDVEIKRTPSCVELSKKEIPKICPEGVVIRGSWPPAPPTSSGLPSNPTLNSAYQGATSLECGGVTISNVNSKSGVPATLEDLCYACRQMLATTEKGKGKDFWQDVAKNNMGALGPPRLVIYGTSKSGPQQTAKDIPEHAAFAANCWSSVSGLGPTPDNPIGSTSSGGLGIPGQWNPQGTKNGYTPHDKESIVIHEFLGHVVETQPCSPLKARILECFEKEKNSDLWKDKYGGKNPAEFYAQGTQYFFDVVARDHYQLKGVSNDMSLKPSDLLKAKSPCLYGVLKDLFGASGITTKDPDPRPIGKLPPSGITVSQ